MENNDIKKMLRVMLNESDREKNYSDIQNKLLKGKLFTISQVMAAAGLGEADDDTARSLFSKKLRKYKNKETGSTYLFNDEELSAIVKVLNNPMSYLSNKK